MTLPALLGAIGIACVACIVIALLFATAFIWLSLAAVYGAYLFAGPLGAIIVGVFVTWFWIKMG